ncbi:unnamed protein product [Cylindrotheca closterium]|uniref:Enhancer of mRNA-decapping protein 4 C-terminal domain-containing protein n=1 Tax=Cylindrotheca closterium TaxID=2856 RepID=A0AAD2JMS1_9STRA|nr:unnamed protein product [Cylindrotheca closterium]
MGASKDEPFGTTAIPTSLAGGVPVEISVDTSTFEEAQQPQTQQIAVYEAKRNDECINGSLLDVNQHFVVYAVKNGLIRVLHRHSAMKALLRGHHNSQVTDIRFFLDGDVLGTVGSDGTTSKLIVWRVFEQSSEIMSEKLLEISTDDFTISRLLWHPFNPNLFCMFQTTGKGLQAATLVETTRIQTTMDETESHAVCRFHSPYCVMDGAVQLLYPDSNIADLAWSGRDPRHILTVHEGGAIILWDLKAGMHHDRRENGGHFTIPTKVAILEEETSPSKCCFLPHENSVSKQDQADTLTTCFVTASENNSVITLWSSFTSSALPTKLQVIRLQNPSPSYVMDLCFGPAPQDASPPSCFLLLADRYNGKLLAVHVQAQWNANKKALCVGADYIVPFALKHPIYSWSVVCSPTQDISEEEIQEQAGLIFDMKLFSYQAKVVQCLTLTSYMCLPPAAGYKDSTPGILVKPLGGAKLASAAGSVEPEYDEEYDVEDEDDDDEPEAPEPSALPTPAAVSTNPFANWLGAIAGVAPSPAPAPEPTPVAPKAPPSGLPPGLAPPGMPARTQTQPEPSAPPAELLNPLELLTKQSPASATQAAPAPTPSKGKPKKPRSKSPKGRNRKKDTSAPPFDGKISILKRDVTPPPPTAMPPVVMPPSDPAIIGIDPGIIGIDPAIIGSEPIPASSELEKALGVSTSAPLPATSGVNLDEITKVVEDVLAAQLEPTVQRVVQESMASFGRPLQASMDNLGKKGVSVNKKDLEAALNVEAPLKSAMADTIRSVFIPAVESITAQVLEQVIKTATPPPPPPPSTDNAKTMEMMVNQLAAMNAKMDGMAQEIATLKTASTRNAGPAAPPMPQPPMPPPPQMDPNEMARNEIVMSLRQQQYEAAFTRALSTKTPEMAVFCCNRADMGIVMAGNPPVLSQTVMLILMQNLGAALNSPNNNEMDVQTELTWLQECALTLDPSDPSIQRHAPSVLQQLVASINQRTSRGEPHLRRPLQMLLQVIRGMQMG